MFSTQAVAGKASLVSKADTSHLSLEVESSYGPDDMTCAICLEQIQLENTAYVKGCEHAYCGGYQLLSTSLSFVLYGMHTSTTVAAA